MRLRDPFRCGKTQPTAEKYPPRARPRLTSFGQARSSQRGFPSRVVGKLHKPCPLCRPRFTYPARGIRVESAQGAAVRVIGLEERRRRLRVCGLSSAPFTIFSVCSLFREKGTKLVPALQALVEPGGPSRIIAPLGFSAAATVADALDALGQTQGNPRKQRPQQLVRGKNVDRVIFQESQVHGKRKTKNFPILPR